MKTHIKEILTKVQHIAQYNPDMSPVKEVKATITIKESNDDLILQSISYDWYDIILVCESGIFLIPEHGQRKTLFNYNGWDGLLKL